MGEHSNDTQGPLQGKVIWLDLASPEDELLSLIESAGGRTTDVFDEQAYALVSSNPIDANEAVELARSIDIPVLTPEKASAQIRQELGLDSGASSPAQTMKQPGPATAVPIPTSAVPSITSGAFTGAKKIHDVGLAALASLAIILAFAMAPSTLTADEQDLVDPADQYASMIILAETNRELNAERTESAPQQQVVNGWTTLDYLAIIASQNNDLISSAYRTVPVNEPPRDHRPATLLALGIVAIAWSRITYVPLAP